MSSNYIDPQAPNSKGSSYAEPTIIRKIILTNSHEQNILVEKNRHDKELIDIKNLHEQALKDKDLGVVGKYFGGRELTALNISGALIMTLAIMGIIFTFILLCQKKEDQPISIIDFWAIITPLITLSLGYIFGNKNAGKRKGKSVN